MLIIKYVLTFLQMSFALEQSQILTLDSQNQFYTQSYQLDLVFSQMDAGIEYGIWTKYVPFAYQISSHQISDCSLIHFITNQAEHVQLIYYVCFIDDTQEIIHYLDLYTQQEKNISVKLNIPNNYQYEGSWLFYHFAYISTQKHIAISLGMIDYEDNYIFSEFDNEQVFSETQLIFNYGYTTLYPSLTSFKGRIVLYKLQQKYQISEIHLRENQIKQLELDISSLLKIDCIEYPYSLSNVLNSPFNEYMQYYTQQLYDRDYLIQGWFKVIGELKLGQKYYFLEITPVLVIRDYQELLSKIVLKLNYYQKGIDRNYYFQIQSYQYVFPNVNNNNYTIGIYDEIEVRQQFQIWHFIIVKYYNNELLINIEMQEKYQLRYNLRQYSNYQLQVSLASSFINSNINLEVQHFQIFQCKDKIKNLTLIPICDSTCRTCSGPTNRDCQSCFSQGCEQCTLTNCDTKCRTFIKKSQQCVCHFGFYDSGIQCLGVSDVGVLLEVTKDQVNEQDYCQIGYYKLMDECIRCPEILNEYGRACRECEVYTYSWINQFVCSTYLYNDNPNHTFRQIENEGNTQYLYQDNEYNVCENCEINSIYGQLSNYKHLDNYQRIICKYGYRFFNGYCIRQIKINQQIEIINQCNISCSKCQNDYCTLCYDQINTYIGLFKPQECIPCLINNCKYCFDYYVNQYLINSFNIYNINQQYDDLITGCALCYQGFTYNFQTRECEQQILLQSYCLQSIIDNNQQICLISNQLEQIAYQYTDCQIYIENCQECIIINDIIQCSICEQGYKFNQNQNKCIQCDQYQYIYQCTYQVISTYKQILYSIQPLYYYMTKTILVIPQIYPSVYAQQCMLGNVQHNGICYSLIQSPCLKSIFNQYQYICQECETTQYGIKIMGTQFLVESVCSKCPYYCRYCIHSGFQDLYNQLNPYYSYQDIPSKCSIAQDNKFIDNKYGRIRLYSNITTANTFNYLSCNNYTQTFQISTTRLPIELVDIKVKLLDLISIDKLIIYYIITEDIQDNCFSYSIIWSETLMYKIYILTLKQQGIVFKSSNNREYQIGKYLLQMNVSFSDLIKFENLKFYINSDLFHNFSTPNLQLYYTNITYYGQLLNNFQFTTKLNSISQLKLINITINDIIIISNLIYDINEQQNYIDYLEILITNVSIYNSILQNSSFINLVPNALLTTITINNLIISNTIFNYSYFINFIDQINKYQIKITKLTLYNCSFNNTIFINFPLKSTIIIDYLSINNSLLLNSIFILFSNQIKINNLIIEQTQIINSTLIKFNQISLSFDQQILYFIFSTFLFNNLVISNTKFLSIQFKTNIDISITFNQIHHYNIQEDTYKDHILYEFIHSSDQSKSLLQINEFIFINNQSYIQGKLSFWESCFTSNGISSLIQINQYTNIIIENVIVQNLLFQDKVMISLNLLNINSENVILRNISILSNLLIHKSGELNLQFISISTSNPIQFQLFNIIITENMAHYYIQPTQYIQSSFMTINSYLSSIQIVDLKLIDNYISNCTVPMLFIDVAYIIIQNMKSLNNNIQILLKFINFMNVQDNQIIEQLVKQQFQVLTNSGLGLINFRSIQIEQSQFINGYSWSSNIFTLICKESCQIEMNNILIQNHSSYLGQQSQIYGCFFIDSSSSILDLQFKDFEIRNISNRLESALLYIIPSQVRNNIQISNITINNIFSLRNGLISIDSQQSYSLFNILLINNIIIQNQQKEFQMFLNKINYLSNYELQLIQQKNGLIYGSNCKVTINNGTFRGLFISQLIELQQNQQVILQNIVFYDIQTTSSLIQINQLENYKLIFYSIQIENITQYIANNQITIPNNLRNYQLNKYENCTLKYIEDLQIIIQYNEEQEDKHNFEFIILQLNTLNIDSIIKITQIRNQFHLLNCQFKNINCTNCSYGTILITSYDHSNITIKESIFSNGSYNNYGQLNIKGDRTNKLFIINSLFQYNKCYLGCGIYLINTYLYLNNCKFLNNYANFIGGSIYYIIEQITLSFINIQNTLFSFNKALQGSSLYLQNTKLSQKSLSQIILTNNSNLNIIELPSSLNCLYNNQKLQVIRNINQSEIIDISSNIIYLPSSIPFQDYQRFNEIQIKYEQFNYSLQFIAVNQIDEPQFNISGSYCTYIQTIINISNSQILLIQDNINKLEFNQSSYQLYNIEFDPYSPQEQVLQIQLQCNLITSYKYLLNLRTYQCQMGEYYSQNGCYKCDYQKGYYSVKKNSIKCSQIDINKIQNNTANLLQLKKGYWRLDIHSEIIEQCDSEYCIGGWNVGDSLCQIGYIGPLCQECNINNYYTKGSNKTCLPCKEDWNSLISMILITFWTFVSILLTVRSLQFANQQFRYLVLTSKFYKIIQKFNQDIAGCLIKMFTNQILVVSSIYSFQIDFTINISWISTISSPSLTNAFNLDCWLVNQSFIDLLYLRMFLIVLIPFMNIIIFFSFYALWIIIKSLKYDSSTLAIAITYIFIITQPDIIKYGGSLIASRTISEKRWVQQDLSKYYDTDTHYQWMYFMAIPILILWCIVFPFYYSLTLYLHRQQLRFSVVRKKLSYLYSEYKSDCYQWEIVKILQRELVVLVITVYKEDIYIQVTLLFFLEFLYLLLIMKLQPYNMDELNKLESKSVEKCIMIIILGHFVYLTQHSNQVNLHFISQIILLFLSLWHIIPFIIRLIQVYLQKYITYFEQIITKQQNQQFKIIIYFKKCKILENFINQKIQQHQQHQKVKETFLRVKQKLFSKTQTLKRIELAYNESQFLRSERDYNNLISHRTYEMRSEKEIISARSPRNFELSPPIQQSKDSIII